MSSIDEIWESMNADVPKVSLSLSGEKKKKKKSDTSTDKKKSSEKKSEAQKVIQSILASSSVSASSPSTSTAVDSSPKPHLKAPRKTEVISTLNDSDMKRKKAMLKYLLDYIKEQNALLSAAEEETAKAALSSSPVASVTPLSSSHYNPNDLLHDYGKLLFQFFTDPNDSCRELSFDVCAALFYHANDFSPVLPYYFSSLFHGMPASISYDTELQVFVFSKELHEDYKRGKAVDRQDRILTSPTPFASTPSSSGASVVGNDKLLKVSPTSLEHSEEIRYKKLFSLSTLVNRVVSLGASPILHSYFSDMILYLQFFLTDSYSDILELVLTLLHDLAQNQDFNLGMRFFSVGLCRQILQVLRHRHWKVRALGVQALSSVLCVPNYEKRKAAGSDCIKDIIGFEEDNVLSVASFYKSEVRVNYLAELVQDHNLTVKMHLLEFLHRVLVEIDDRYDHQTRFLPYLLDLLTDSSEEVSQGALRVLELCGKEYESEHGEEILEKKQYGLDGDVRMNLSGPMLPPFRTRPSLGLRLYVRGNTKRFLYALIHELTSWQSKVRLKSANLLKVVLFLCEESLAMESYKLLPSLLKALKFARDDSETDLSRQLEEALELLGRFMNPDVYLFFLIPRLRGDAEISSSAQDATQVKLLVAFTRALCQGSLIQEILPHLAELLSVLLSSPYLQDDVSVQKETLRLLLVPFRGFQKEFFGKNNALYNSLAPWRDAQHALFQHLFEFSLSCLYSGSLVLSEATQLIDLLAQIFTGKSQLFEARRLFYSKFSVPIAQKLLESYSVDLVEEELLGKNGVRTTRQIHHTILCRLLVTPYYSLQTSSTFALFFTPVLKRLLTNFLYDEHSNSLSDAWTGVLSDLADLLLFFFSPLLLDRWVLKDVAFQVLCAQFQGEQEMFCVPSTTTVSSSPELKNLLLGVPTAPSNDIIQILKEPLISSNFLSILLSNLWTSNTLLLLIRLQLFVVFHNSFIHSDAASIFSSALQSLFQISLKHATADVFFNVHVSNAVLEQLSHINNSDERDEPVLTTKDQVFPLTDTLKKFSIYGETIFMPLLAPQQLPGLRLMCLQYLISFGQSVVKSQHFPRLKTVSSTKNELNPVVYSNLLNIQELSVSLLSIILDSLNDSHDEIRGKCLEAFYTSEYSLVRLFRFSDILSHQDPEGMCLSCLYRNFFDNVFDIFLSEISSLSNEEISTDPSEEAQSWRENSYTKLFVSSELALRSLCILSPQNFEMFLREALQTRQVDLSGSEMLNEAVQALFSHAHVLSTLNK